MSAHGLLPELWAQIICHVPQFEQPKLLGLSRMFHDIAACLVFSAVKVYIIGGDSAYALLNTTHGDFKDEATTKLMTRSYQLLRRMATDPSFARIVRSLTVVTSSDSESV